MNETEGLPVMDSFLPNFVLVIGFRQCDIESNNSGELNIMNRLVHIYRSRLGESLNV